MRSSYARTLGWAASGFIVSGAVFAAIHVALFLVEPPPTAPPDPSLSSLAAIAGYGIFHWVLLGLLTLPVLLAPVLIWPWVLRAFPSAERSPAAFVIAIGVLSAIAIALRAGILNYPVLRKDPASLIQQAYLLEYTSLWLGLLLPRFIIPALRLSSLSARGAA